MALSRRCGWHNTVQLQRRDIMHLHELFFCLRMSVHEEVVLAKKLAELAVEMPTSDTSVWSDLCINGQPATIKEDERLWQTVTMFCSNRPVPDVSWDPQGTIEFCMHLPLKWRRMRGAVRLQAAGRGLLARRRLAQALGRLPAPKAAVADGAETAEREP